MKLLSVIVLTFLTLSTTAKADMFGIGAGVGQNSTPSYGLDYELLPRGEWWPCKPYADFALYGSQQAIQPYFSMGGQGQLTNFGIAFADTNVNHGNGLYESQFSIGPELGFQKNLTDAIYVKENNAYLDFHGTFLFQATFSLGLNL